MITRVFHTGLAVENLDNAIKMYTELGFTITNEFYKEDLKAKAVVLNKGEANYELFEFEDTSHPQFQYIRNHVAFFSDSLEEDLQKFLDRGYKLTIPITEGKIVRYAYVQDSIGTNIEIATSKIPE